MSVVVMPVPGYVFEFVQGDASSCGGCWLLANPNDAMCEDGTGRFPAYRGMRKPKREYSPPRSGGGARALGCRNTTPSGSAPTTVRVQGTDL
eukprot:3113843-Prymnesium_polylepis.2